MAQVTKQFTFTAGTTILSSRVNTDFDDIYNEFNGNIDNANIKANAAIVDTKLAQITTASKVSTSALTGSISASNLTGSVGVTNGGTGLSVTGSDFQYVRQTYTSSNFEYASIFYNRGDPTGEDYTVGNFTTDATWRDLDLSAIVPVQARAVLLHIQISDDAVGSTIRFRKNGNTSEISRSTISTQVTNISNYADLVVPCDTNRVIEYNASNLAWVGINVTVKGWWA